MDASTRGERIGRLLRLGVSGGERASSGDAALGELEMELALLREENARLKVERHRTPDAGRVIERMRHLGNEHGVEPLDRDAAVRSSGPTIEDCPAIRDGLIAACQEVQQAMQGIRERLGALAVDLHNSGSEPSMPVGEPPVMDAPALSEAEKVELDLTVGARVPSTSFVQSAV